jgi:hypothetical protein
MAAKSRVLLPNLNFALRLHVLSFLSFEDLTTLHICSRYSWLIAQRAVYHARALQAHPQHARFLRKHERKETVVRLLWSACICFAFLLTVTHGTAASAVGELSEVWQLAAQRHHRDDDWRGHGQRHAAGSSPEPCTAALRLSGA